MSLVVTGPQNVRVRHEAGFVMLIYNGKMIFSCPAAKAREIAKALMAKAGLAEEWENPQKTIMDQAILDRLGVPMRLTQDPVLRHEAFKESQHDKDLRRYISGPRARGIPSEEKFGTPTITVHPPKKEPENGTA